MRTIVEILPENARFSIAKSMTAKRRNLSVFSSFSAVESSSVVCNHSCMEPLNIYVISIIDCGNYFRARARATAQDAKITLEVTFATHPESSKSELWDPARDKVLRYLGPAQGA